MAKNENESAANNEQPNNNNNEQQPVETKKHKGLGWKIGLGGVVAVGVGILIYKAFFKKS